MSSIGVFANVRRTISQKRQLLPKHGWQELLDRYCFVVAADHLSTSRTYSSKGLSDLQASEPHSKRSALTWGWRNDTLGELFLLFVQYDHMSGHSKWSTIKRQKAVTDSKRSAAFTKLARLITVAARIGGGDPDMNFRLRLAIDKAKAANVPNDNIERAIKSGTGEGKDTQTKDVLYEGFGPGGVAIMVEAITDNSNRTAAEVRGVFSKHGGSMGGQNSVGWMFERSGVAQIPLPAPQSREALELELIDAGATDVRDDSGQLVITCAPELLMSIRQLLAKSGFTAEADTEFLPTTTVTVDAATRENLYNLLGALDDLDDVTHVYSNDA